MDDVTLHFALALVALVLSAIAVVQSRLASVLAWACVAGSAGLSLYLHTLV